MNNKLVSIVIPMFNTEKYISKCLDSLINQTYSNIEILVIDDGSTDSSKNIVNEYCEKDKRIKYYYQENSGVGIARNKGINLSNGEYIVFVDSDDYVTNNFITKLVYSIKEDDIFSICGTFRVKFDGSIEENTVKKEFIDSFRGIASYKRLLNKKKLSESKIMFSDLKICEDLEFYSKLLIKFDKKYSIVDECLYYYVERSDSLIHTYSKNQKDTLNAVNRIISFSKKINKYESNKDELDYLFIAHVLGGYLSRFVLSGKTFNEFKNEYIKLNNIFSDWKNNKYIYCDDYIPKKYTNYLIFLKSDDLLSAYNELKK